MLVSHHNLLVLQNHGESNMSEIRPSRRQFVSGVAAAAAVSIVKPSLVRGTQANSKVKLGLIGCGGRGVWIAKLFQDHGGYELMATADYFADRANQAGDALGVPSGNRFDQLSGYKRLLESGVDAVAIESPPYFHPGQAADAVDAGLHVYVAKPIAVDVPGCQSIQESGERSTANKKAFLIDFQTRADQFYMEAIKRVHAGALGPLSFGEATYHAGVPWGAHVKALAENPHDPEVQLKAWGLSKVLSGDIITEQNIHTLDVMNWIMDKPPVSVWGTCSKKGRVDNGTCHDSFVLTYNYGDGLAVSFSSRQFNGYGSKPDGILNRVFGLEGVLETSYGGPTRIRGGAENTYRGGSSPAIYKEGAEANIATFHRQIMEESFENTTVKPSVQSNLVTIMGRTAAYTGDVVTWEQTIQSTEKLVHDMKGLKA
jgi:myo-inositol 2-dehydrogenase/D-chiro-inositol 1-dehydrogenase